MQLQCLYKFVWHEFCDWYLEWLKDDLYGDDELAKATGQTILFTLLEIILKLLHPITPFVTEEIWSVLPGNRSSIMTEPFPEQVDSWNNPEADAAAELLMGVVTGLRNIRSETGIHPSARIDGFIICPVKDKADVLKNNSKAIRERARIEELHVLQEGKRPRGAASYIFNEIEIYVPLAGLVDIAQEMAKLEKEKGKVEKQLAKVEGKLGNRKFLDNAPPEVVAKEEDKKETFAAKLGKIKESMEMLQQVND